MLEKTRKPLSFICFDFGTKRFGVAIGNDMLKSARSLDPIKARDGIPDWEQIDKLILEWQPDEFVVGLPLNMDGTESDMSARAKKFKNRLASRTRKTVHLMDERLSSFEAKGHVIKQKGHVDFGTYSVDGQAAALILESWFSQRENS